MNKIYVERPLEDICAYSLSGVCGLVRLEVTRNNVTISNTEDHALES